MAGRSAETGKPEYPVKVTAEANEILNELLYSHHRTMKSDSITHATRLLQAACLRFNSSCVEEAVGKAIAMLKKTRVEVDD